MDCKKVDEVLFSFIDNEIEADLASLLRAHFSRCPSCAERLDHSRKVLVVVRQRCVRRLAPGRLRLRILRSLPHRQTLN